MRPFSMKVALTWISSTIVSPNLESLTAMDTFGVWLPPGVSAISPCVDRVAWGESGVPGTAMQYGGCRASHEVAASLLLLLRGACHGAAKKSGERRVEMTR